MSQRCLLFNTEEVEAFEAGIDRNRDREMRERQTERERGRERERESPRTCTWETKHPKHFYFYDLCAHDIVEHFSSFLPLDFP